MLPTLQMFSLEFGSLFDVGNDLQLLMTATYIIVDIRDNALLSLAGRLLSVDGQEPDSPGGDK